MQIMTVKGQKNHYNIKVLRGYGVSIALKDNKVCLCNGTDIFIGEAEKEEWASPGHPLTRYCLFLEHPLFPGILQRKQHS